jgi:hypothetical protein
MLEPQSQTAEFAIESKTHGLIRPEFREFGLEFSVTCGHRANNPLIHPRRSHLPAHFWLAFSIMSPVGVPKDQGRTLEPSRHKLSGICRNPPRARNQLAHHSLDVFTVFAGPVKSIALRQYDGLLHRLLRITRRASQAAAFELHADISRIVLAID